MVGTREIAGATIFTAFVFVTTFSFAVATSTGGYFDVGEIMVYITALLMGPYVGAFAGGVGSALSDALLAPQFAPGTLVIKAGEGFIVGYLGQKGFGNLPDVIKRRMGFFLGLAVAVIVLAVGLISFPDAYLQLGQSPFTPVATTADVPISVAVWVLFAAAAFGATFFASSKIGPRHTWIALAILAGGAEMVTGYFLYETGILQIGLAAPLAEIPVNALQAIAGLVVAPPVAMRVQGAFQRRIAAAGGPTAKELGKGSSA